MTVSDKQIFDFFISHSSATKELARWLYYNSFFNGFSAWFDERLLNVGDFLKSEIETGVSSSNGFVLLYCEPAAKSPWVQEEMRIAMNRKLSDSSFKIIVVKLDDYVLDKWWDQYLFLSWNGEDRAGSLIKLIEAVTGKKSLQQITTAALFNTAPTGYFRNESGSISDHTRNFALYYFSHLKKLLVTSSQGRKEELVDTITKISKLFLMDMLPSLDGGPMCIGPGLWEYIFAVRMRIPPTITIEGLPDRYKYEVIEKNEISARIKISDSKSNQPIDYAIPFAMKVVFDARL